MLYGPAPARRIMFIILFLMLGGAMVAGFNPETDLAGTRLLKTIGFAAVLLVLLGAGGWSGVTGFDRGAGTVETISSLFGVTVRRKILARVGEIHRIVLQKVVLLQSAPPGGRQGVFGNLFEPRSELIRLFLETDNGRIHLDEGGNTDVLEQTGVFFAEFLNVPFSSEELEP